MKTLFTTLFLALISLGTFAQNGITITVQVPVPSEEGTLIAGLYDEATFLKSEPLQDKDSNIVDGYATLVFENVLPGTYAIALYHDKNGNKIMDFEPNGMPKEMFGASNNVMAMGPPTWRNAKFDVSSEDIEMEIRL